MIIDEELLEVLNNLSAVVKESLSLIKDSNILKRPMMDFCAFADSAKVGDPSQQYAASLVAAMNLSGLITTELAEEKLDVLRSHGIYGAWEKRGVLESMRYKSNVIDSWIALIADEPGDLVIPYQIIQEWHMVVELAKLEPVGGVQ